MGTLCGAVYGRYLGARLVAPYGRHLRAPVQAEFAGGVYGRRIRAGAVYVRTPCGLRICFFVATSWGGILARLRIDRKNGWMGGWMDGAAVE